MPVRVAKGGKQSIVATSGATSDIGSRTGLWHEDQSSHGSGEPLAVRECRFGGANPVTAHTVEERQLGGKDPLRPQLPQAKQDAATSYITQSR